MEGERTKNADNFFFLSEMSKVTARSTFRMNNKNEKIRIILGTLIFFRAPKSSKINLEEKKNVITKSYRVIATL